MRKLLLPLLLIVTTIAIHAQHLDTIPHFKQSLAKNNCNDLRYACDGVRGLPYPILFIHGWTGQAGTWDTMFNFATERGWTYGGCLNFCLNADREHSTSHIDEDFKSFVNESRLTDGDFYILNFDVAPNGAANYFDDGVNTYLSNQAAVAKQGKAVAYAIYHIRRVTGAEKVILFGHSMGGLAARECLQNWEQPNGHHGVGKLVTSGTPHLGSDRSFGSVDFLDYFDYFGLKLDSEAVRDLRESYRQTEKKGVYLYGGYESKSYMDDEVTNDFVNYDVDCDGIEQTHTRITGLNEKWLQDDLEFAMIVGNSLGEDKWDGIVYMEEADLKNRYPSMHREWFQVITDYASIDPRKYLHSRLPDYTTINLIALDEADDFEFAYEIEPDRWHFGYIQKQGRDARYEIDYDDYTFELLHSGDIQIDVRNNAYGDFGFAIHDGTNYLYTWQSDGNINLKTTPFFLPRGNYYLEFFATPDDALIRYPYSFNVQYQEEDNDFDLTATDSFLEQENFTVSPNPASDWIYIEGDWTSLKIFNTTGKQVLESTHQSLVEIGKLASGIYSVVLYDDLGTMLGRRNLVVI